MKKILYPAPVPTHRRTKARRYHHRRRRGARTIIRIGASFPRPAAHADLVGADRDHPLRYAHELHDVFDQFLF